MEFEAGPRGFGHMRTPACARPRMSMSVRMRASATRSRRTIYIDAVDITASIQYGSR
ncbi:hypothetical protein [Candidimonas nitroreducens]|uniref:hypothetical protein n=1 Tax=Candidimonas nitroreducens TaxID=683354 RepID=UPI0013032589|nr:hypothetical protein [Candidimonas nitroreducens]